MSWQQKRILIECQKFHKWPIAPALFITFHIPKSVNGNNKASVRLRLWKRQLIPRCVSRLNASVPLHTTEYFQWFNAGRQTIKKAPDRKKHHRSCEKGRRNGTTSSGADASVWFLLNRWGSYFTRYEYAKKFFGTSHRETLGFRLRRNLDAILPSDAGRNTREGERKLSRITAELIQAFVNKNLFKWKNVISIPRCSRDPSALRQCRHKRFSSLLRLKKDLFAGVNDKERPTRIERFLFIARTSIPLLWQTSLKLGSSSCKTEQPSRFALTSANMGHWSENSVAFVCAKLRGQQWLWPLSMTFWDFFSHFQGFPSTSGTLLDSAIYFIGVSSVSVSCVTSVIQFEHIFAFSLSRRKFLSNGSHQIKCLQLLELFKSLEKSLFMHENPFEMKLLLWQFVKYLKKAFNALTIKRSCYLRAAKPVEKCEVLGFRRKPSKLQDFNSTTGF